MNGSGNPPRRTVTRFVLVKNATDRLRAIVEVDEEQFAVIEVRALADFGQEFSALHPGDQARVVEDCLDRDLDYAFYQCGDTDSAEVSDYSRFTDLS